MTNRAPLPRPVSRRLTRTMLCAGIALLVAASLAAASLVRVPASTLGFAGGSVLRPGLHLVRPFQRVRLVPLSVRIDAIDLERRTGEGASVTIRLSFDYRLDAGAIETDAPLIAALGLEGAVRRAAGEALDAIPAGTWLPSDLSAARGGGLPLPAAALQAIDKALGLHGVIASELTARAAPSGSLPPPENFASRTAGQAGALPGAIPAGGAMPDVERTGARLLMIGLDGADWDSIDPLLRQGKLPNLARLIARGVRAPLRSYDPMISPLLWTTMVTGVGPDVHGVADFQAIDAATGRRVPITSRFRKVKAAWNILSDAAEASDFVAWWASYPTEKVEGVQVSNLVVFEALRPKPPGSQAAPGITWPIGYFDAIRPRLRTAADLTYEEIRPMLHIGRDEFAAARAELLRPPSSKDDALNRRLAQKPIPLAMTILTGTRNYATIAADLAARHDPMTAVYFEGIDMFGHRFQHCMPPRMALCPDQDYRAFRDAVTTFYEAQDSLLGPILEAAGPEATVLVVSDHGFKTGDGRPSDLLPFTTEQPVEWHDQEGIFILSGPASRHGERLASLPTLFDIMPTILYLMGLPAAQNMPGRVLLEALDPGLTGSHPVRTIASYEPLGSPRSIAAPAGEGAREAEEELLANLRALGYIGGDATEAPGHAGGAGEQTQVFYHRNLAMYLLKHKEYAKAVEQLLVANQREKLPKNYQMLSEAYVGLGRVDDAIAALEEGLRTIERNDPEAVLWMVQIDLSRPGGPAAAREVAARYAALTAKRPGLDDAIAGLLREQEGDRSGAAALYRKSLAADPTRVVAAQRRFAIEGADRARDLEPLLRRALAKDRRIDEYHNLLGLILASTGRNAEAIDSFRRAADLDPDNARFAANLGASLARAGRWEEAAPACEKAAALDPSADNLMKLGSIARRLGRPEQALQAFARAREAGDDGSAPVLGMALARVEMKQVPEALALLRERLDQHPDEASLRALYDDLVRKTRTPGSAPDRPGSGR